MYSRRYTPERITELAPDEIFVFGSNLAGAHGGGAARLAYQRFGAVWGEGVGHHGQTYGIPTMQVGVDTIKPYVDDFIRYAKAHPNLTFLVTRIGCGIAGFRDKDIAPLFKNALKVDNIILPEAFVDCLAEWLIESQRPTVYGPPEWFDRRKETIPQPKERGFLRNLFKKKK